MKPGIFVFTFCICFLMVLSLDAQLQLNKPVPPPRSMQLQEDNLSLKDLFRLTGDMVPSSINRDLIKEMFDISDNPTAKLLEINSSFFDTPKQRQSGAYHIIIDKNKVTIDAFDQRGLFYALQTLAQLQKKTSDTRSLPVGEITDYPAVPIRGTVEGFYGDPWTHQDRINQLKFYGKFKLNTYIYGPKDDPYHSSPNWRKPYPPQEEQRIKQLVEEAKRNYVDFVWAIHPGQDIKWTSEDSLNIIVKFEWMYQLGVRNFAVFFDDISGAGTDATRQAQLLNYIQEAFVKPKKDVGPLIMCPTEYNKLWANKNRGTYLDILGDKLHPSVYVMWTGNSVISDNTVEGLEWVNKRIKRKALVWWNFPVSDYVRDHLLMGPAYGLDKDAAPYMSGFVSNPMDKSEASKVALFGVSWYTWNPETYDFAASWEAANQYLMPEAPKLFRLFNAHNSDLGPNGHGYRRDESVQIKPVIDSFTTSLKKSSYSQVQAKKIKQLFDSIRLAGRKIPELSHNNRLIEQIKPWLIQFTYLGESGSQGMQMLESYSKKNMPAVWSHYLQLDKYLDSMSYADGHYNQNPYQPGVKTGSLVLTPFVKVLKQKGTEILLGTGARGVEPESSQSTSALKTNIAKLENQPLQKTNSSVSISPVLEVITLGKGQFAGIELAENLLATHLSYHLQSQSFDQWAVLQVSVDGTVWKNLEDIGKNGKGNVGLQGGNYRFVRLMNASDKNQSFFLKQFKVDIAPADGEKGHFEFDRSLDTYETIEENKPFQLSLPEDYQKKEIRILLSKPSGAKVVVNGYKKGFKRPKELYEGKAGYIVIPVKKMKRIKNLSIAIEGATSGKLYEILKRE